MLQRLRQLRYAAHGLNGSKGAHVASVVAHLGAVQSQEAAQSHWGVGVRMPGTTKEAINKAFEDRGIVRTWAMRGTLQLLAAEDAAWIVALVGPPAIRKLLGPALKVGFDAKAFAFARDRMGHHLSGKGPVLRSALLANLEADGMPTKGIQGGYLLFEAAESGLICFGPDQGKEDTIALMAEWLPTRPRKDREEAVIELAYRYFSSHGPATDDDFAMFSGLNLGDARMALDGLKTRLSKLVYLDKTYWFGEGLQDRADIPSLLLPGYDEYFVSYRDRDPILSPEHRWLAMSSNGIFRPTLLVNGELVGTWQRSFKAKHIEVELQPFQALEATVFQELTEKAQEFAAFYGKAEARVRIGGAAGALYKR